MSQQYLDFAIDVAKETGELLLQYFGNMDSCEISFKGVFDLVTQADKEAEKLIADRILQAFPSHGILGEEFGERKGSEDYLWIVDPLDGTNNFAHGHPCFATSIGLLHDGVIQVGVIYLPKMQELFYASLGQGAYLNSKKISVSQRQPLQNCLLATGFPYKRNELKQNNLDNFNTLLMQCRGIRRCGAAAQDLCYVACGRYDGFWELWLNPHDVAAGSLIVQEAGGMVSDFSGGTDFLFGCNMIASNGKIHQEIQQNLAPFFIEIDKGKP